MSNLNLVQHSKAMLKIAPWGALVMAVILAGSLFFAIPRFHVVSSGAISGIIFVPILLFYWRVRNQYWSIALFLLIILVFPSARKIAGLTEYFEVFQFMVILLGTTFLGLFITKQFFVGNLNENRS